MSNIKFARPHRPSVEELAQGVLAGNRALLGRAITLIESNAVRDQESSRALISRLLPHSGNAVRIGITGVPGAGKSSFIEAFGTYLCKKGFKVAVLAIDPSSSVSRGSIMGDKTRMEELSGEENAFIRPSPSGGSLGGVARKTRETMIACEAAGFDIILIETVGVGQSETTVRSMVDIFMLLLITGAGDDLQGIKRGIMELADILVVTKDDGDNRQRAAAHCRETGQTGTGKKQFFIALQAGKSYTPPVQTSPFPPCFHAIHFLSESSRSPADALASPMLRRTSGGKRQNPDGDGSDFPSLRIPGRKHHPGH